MSTISVVIPTWNRANLLTTRSVPSVLNQTFQDFELIIVGDGCTDNTGDALFKIKDPRITWVNISERGSYPEEAGYRWMVAGVTPVNRGYEIAKGKWIADLDDDDEFTPNHLADLYEFGESGGFDVVYGQARGVPHGNIIGKLPLMCGNQTRCSVMHKREKGFRYDIDAWKINEPADWNFMKRARESGAKIGFLPKVVTLHYPERQRLGQ